MVKIPKIPENKESSDNPVNIYQEPDSITFKLIKNGKVYLFDNKNLIVENFRNNIITGICNRITNVLEENKLTDKNQMNYGRTNSSDDNYKYAHLMNEEYLKTYANL